MPPSDPASAGDLRKLLTPPQRRALLRLLEKITEANTHDLLRPYDDPVRASNELTAAIDSHREWAGRVLDRVETLLGGGSSSSSSGTPRPQRPPHARPPGAGAVRVAGEEGKERQEEVLAPRDLEMEWLRFHYPPVSTPLERVLKPEDAEAVTQAVLLMLLSLETYDARSRILLLYLASSLGVPLRLLDSQEAQTAKTLLEAAEEMERNPPAPPPQQRLKSKWAWGAATVGGALLIGLTGGLAAPLLAAGLSGVFGAVGLGGLVTATYLGALASSPVIIGGLFGYYGGKTVGGMYSKYVDQVKDWGFIGLEVEGNQVATNEKRRRRDENEYGEPASPAPLPSAPPPKSLRINICVSGWNPTPSPSTLTTPWRSLPAASTRILRYDLENNTALGTSLTRILTSTATLVLTRELATRTALATLYAALWPLALLRASRVLDNPYHVCRHRAESAGKALAYSLLSHHLGRRPVSLYAFSIGAKVLWHCLLTLAREPEGKGLGIVEDVVFLGAPIPAKAEEEWRLIRMVVAGRIVNGYVEGDWVLGFLEREWYKPTAGVGVAGLEPVQGVVGVENVDLGKRVGGHLEYARVAGEVVEEVLRDEVKEVPGSKVVLPGENDALIEFDEGDESAAAPTETGPHQIQLVGFDLEALSLNEGDAETEFEKVVNELEIEQDERERQKEEQRRKKEELEERRRIRAEERALRAAKSPKSGEMGRAAEERFE